MYLKTDVLLLVDVFENFMITYLTYYELDPSNCLRFYGMLWDAMLLNTGVKLGPNHRSEDVGHDRQGKARKRVRCWF